MVADLEKCKEGLKDKANYASGGHQTISHNYMAHSYVLPASLLTTIYLTHYIGISDLLTRLGLLSPHTQQPVALLCQRSGAAKTITITITAVAQLRDVDKNATVYV